MTLPRHDATPNRVAYARFTPHLHPLPSLPAIDWSAISAQAPTPLTAPANELPSADVVVITWTSSEWAALEQVFLRSGTAMSPSSAVRSSWPEWQRYDADMPSYTGRDAGDWRYWGWYSLVRMGSKRILLFKSNTHLVWPGQSYVADLVQRLIDRATPALVVSAGTAGGSRLQDPLGTVNVVNAASLYAPPASPGQWPTYASRFAPGWATARKPLFGVLLQPIPAVPALLQELTDQFNAFYHTRYRLEDLDPYGLNRPTALPALNDLTPGAVPLLTTPTFVVGTTDNRFGGFACIEMDDAVVAQACARNGVPFCFVRNISDPVQSTLLPPRVQGDWGSAVYQAFGLYTSFNGALLTWAVLDAYATAGGGAPAVAPPVPA